MKQINFRKNEKITVGLILLLLCIFLAVLVPALSPWTSTEMHADIRNQGISFSHPFGTDKFGRDLFVRVWCGVRISSVAYTHRTLPKNREAMRSVGDALLRKKGEDDADEKSG